MPDKPIHISRPETDDYWDNKEREHEVEGATSVALNPHQFGDQGTLFHASLGQPDAGIVRGNPHASVYRAIQVPDHLNTPESVLEFASRPGQDRGHKRSLGLHWQHDLTYAEDLSTEVVSGNWGRHGNNSHAVILEADHPGLDHVMHYDHPDTKVRKTLTDTVGPPEESKFMLPEVPVRPGAPMHVRAVHTPHPTTSGAFVRNPVQFKGFA